MKSKRVDWQWGEVGNLLPAMAGSRMGSGNRHPADRARSSAPHVSQIIRKIAQQTRMIGPDERESTEQENVKQMRMAMGLAWEIVVFAKLQEGGRGVDWQPGELERDGIVGNPDGVEEDGEGGWLVHEVKLTWQWVKPIEECWMWLRQGMGYLAMLRGAMLEARKCQYHVGYVNGAGKGPMGVTWECEWTEAEIEGAWKQLAAQRNAK